MVFFSSSVFLEFFQLTYLSTRRKVLTSFCVCIKKLFGAKNREGVVIVNTAPGLFGQYSFFRPKIIQVREGMVGGRKGFLLFLAASLVLITKILTIIFTFYLFACS